MTTNSIADLQSELAAALKTIEHLTNENKLLVHYIEEMRRRLYGRSSEKINPNQLMLFDEAQAAVETPSPVAESTKPAKPREGHGRKPFSPHLPRELIVHDVPEAERVCTCGAVLVSIGEDVCERGHIIPAKIVVMRHVSKKYACPKGHGVKTGAGAPSGLVEKAKFEPSVYAHIAVAKYGDHLPLNRQEAIFKRYGIELSKSTMVDMLRIVHETAAKPIIEQMKKEILAERVIQADETPIAVLLEGEQGSKTGWVWVWRGGRKILFEFRTSRGRDGPVSFLGSWKGTLQIDGYAGYDEVIRMNAIVRAACWAHVRRRFFEAFEGGSADAANVLGVIAKLYHIEAVLKKRIAAKAIANQDATALRRSVRQRRSRVVIDRIEKLIDTIAAKPSTVPKSPLGKAVDYAKNLRPALRVFLDDGDVEIDNNTVERAIRPVAVGRRNWLFAGSDRGAKVAAGLYSLVNACKALGINPEAYIDDVLQAASPNADFSRLTPWAWAANRGIAINS